ncbi:MAG: hypothetical protein IJG16_02620 [Clostridia bacterium]|nr:hypothetical protein [Clostridia bacterium]
MKRLLSLSIVFAILMSLCKFSANAAGMTVTVGTASCLAGETVSIPIALSGNTGFSNLGIEIEYDETFLTLTNITAGQTGATYTAAQSIAANPYNMVWNSTSNNSFNGTIATLDFEIAANAALGGYPITLSYYKGRNGDYEDGSDVNYDEDFNALNLTYVSGSVEVVSSMPTPTTNPSATTVPDPTATPTSSPSVVEPPNPHVIRNNSISITDIQNNPLEFNANLYSDVHITGFAIAAVYDINGVLIAVKCYDAASEVPFSFSDIQNAENVKVFWWDSIGGMTPQANTKTVIL